VLYNIHHIDVMHLLIKKVCAQQLYMVCHNNHILYPWF